VYGTDAPGSLVDVVTLLQGHVDQGSLEGKFVASRGIFVLLDSGEEVVLGDPMPEGTLEIRYVDAAALNNDFDLSPEASTRGSRDGFTPGSRRVHFNADVQAEGPIYTHLQEIAAAPDREQRGPTGQITSGSELRLLPREELLGMIAQRKAWAEQRRQENEERGEEEDRGASHIPEWKVHRDHLAKLTEWELQRDLSRPRMQRHDFTLKDWRGVNAKRSHSDGEFDPRLLTILGKHQPYRPPSFLKNEKQMTSKRSPNNQILQKSASKPGPPDINGIGLPQGYTQMLTGNKHLPR